MHYVYCLISLKNPKFHYYGSTGNVESRLKEHKRGKVRTTHRFAPIELLGYKKFDTEVEAVEFEKKLKKSSDLRTKFLKEIQGSSSEAHLPAGRQVT